MALDGSSAIQLTPEPLGRYRISVSSDNKWIYYDNTKGEARRGSTDGGQSEPTFSADLLGRLGEPLPRGFHEAIPSPDGTLISGHYGTPQGERIIVVPIGGGALKRFDTVPPNASWAPDGRSLIYSNSRGGIANLMRQPLAGGPAAPITQFTAEQIFAYALSPDQKQLAVVRGQVSSDVVLVSSAAK